jgi:hypothetical protein
MHTPNWFDYHDEVAIFLVIGEDFHRIGKIGPDYMILVNPPEIPPGTQARLVMTVNGCSRSDFVVLHNGARAHLQEPVAFF